MLATLARTLDAARRVHVFVDTEAAAIGKAVPPTVRAMHRFLRRTHARSWEKGSSASDPHHGFFAESPARTPRM